MTNFLDPLLGGALTTDTCTWFSPSFPNGQSQKAQLVVENTTSVQTLDTIGRTGGSLTPGMVTTVYTIVTACQLAGTGNPDAAEFQLKGVWLRSGGSLIVIKAPVVIDSNPNLNGSAWTAVLLASGTSVLVRVKGDTGKTVRFSSVTTFYEGG